MGILFLKKLKKGEDWGVTFRFRHVELQMIVGISEESYQIIGIWNSFTEKLQCQEKMTKDKILGNDYI